MDLVLFPPRWVACLAVLVAIDIGRSLLAVVFHHSLARLYVCDLLDRDVGRAGGFVSPVKMGGKR
jgi:hypothetical protein